MQLGGIFKEEVHAGPGEQWGLNWSHQDFPQTLPQFFFQKIHQLLRICWDEKLKVDLFKACLSDTFLGFITFL